MDGVDCSSAFDESTLALADVDDLSQVVVGNTLTVVVVHSKAKFIVAWMSVPLTANVFIQITDESDSVLRSF